MNKAKSVPDSPMASGLRPDESLRRLERRVVSCHRCPRLVAFRKKVGQEARRRYADWDYWSRPVPGFGDARACLIVIGLAPAPHGGNRTGRVFTGDRSGDFLMRALYTAGFCSQPTSESRDNGLSLRNAYLTAAVKCAPPANKPEASEIDNCSGFLQEELRILKSAGAILCLGQIAYRATLKVLLKDVEIKSPVPKFRHGLRIRLDPKLPIVLASYHPSPRNTQTGKLTERMLVSLLFRIRRNLQPSPSLGR